MRTEWKAFFKGGRCKGFILERVYEDSYFFGTKVIAVMKPKGTFNNIVWPTIKFKPHTLKVGEKFKGKTVVLPETPERVEARRFMNKFIPTGSSWPNEIPKYLLHPIDMSKEEQILQEIQDLGNVPVEKPIESDDWDEANYSKGINVPDARREKNPKEKPNDK